MSSHRRNQTHRQIPREIEAGVPENRSQKKQSARQKPTDPWVFGYGKPRWETAAETLWETEVWCLLYVAGFTAIVGKCRKHLTVAAFRLAPPLHWHYCSPGRCACGVEVPE